MAFTDMLGQYVDNRIQNAGDRLNQAYGLMTGDENAWNQQFGMGETEEERKKRLRREAQARGEVLPDDVVETTQVKTYGDGSQTETTKREIPAAPVAPEPQPQTALQPEPIQQPQMSMAERAHQQQMAAQAQPQAQPQPQPQAQPQAQPQPQQASMPVAPVAPETQPQPQAVAPVAPAVPQMPPMPQPGPGVQVAGPAQMPPQPVQQPAAAPGANLAQMAQAAAPQATDYSAELRAIANDPRALAAYIGSKDPKDPSVKIANDLYMLNMQGTVKAADAEKILGAAAQGDRQAQNQLMKDLRSEEGSYIKAILYSRLGLNKLAEEEQMKLGGGKTIGRALLDGAGYTVETNARGAITRAWDENGNRADEKTLNRINALGQKQGSQAYGFTGGQYVVPSTGEPLQPRTNSITGQAEYVHMMGPKKGQVYAGTEIPQQQRITTNAMVDYNRAQIKFATEPNIAAAQELLKNAANNDTGDGREINRAKAAIADRLGPAALNQIIGGMPAAVVGGGAPGQNVQQVGNTERAGGGTTPQGTIVREAPITSTGTSTGQLTYTPSAKRPGESENMYQSRLKKEEAAFQAEVQKRKELEVAEGKPPAEARGKNVAKDINNQNFADSTYELIRPIANLVKQSTGSGIGAKVDSIAAVFGASPSGAQAIAQLEPMVYPILANVPRFEGPQSDYDVKTYMKAAGDFANPEKPIATRLAALQGMITLLKKYDKAGKNDWTFGEGQTGGIKIIKREKVQ